VVRLDVVLRHSLTVGSTCLGLVEGMAVLCGWMWCSATPCRWDPRVWVWRRGWRCGVAGCGAPPLPHSGIHVSGFGGVDGGVVWLDAVP
jgi:hypothetical protein